MAAAPDADPRERLSIRDGGGALPPALIEAVRAAIAGSDRIRLNALAGDLHEADLGDLVEALDHDERPRLVALMGRDFDFTALTEVDDTVREDILEEIPNAAIAEGVKELDSDDAVTILEGLAEADQEEVLANLPADERSAVSAALDYPENSAGRLMRTDLISVPPGWTVGQTIDHLREAADLPDDFFEVFVVDAAGKFLGNVFLDKLARAKRPVRMEDIMARDRHRIDAAGDRHEIALMFERYNLVSAPVVTGDGRLAGVITIDDIVDVIQEEAEESVLALGGVNRDEEISDSIWTITKSRFGWLFINLMTAFLAASVLKLFQVELEKMVALAVLAPIVASQGGNAATQTMTVAVRAIATQELGTANFARVLIREVSAAMLNGLAFALITGAVSALWFQNTGLGMVIGGAMLINLIAGALGGVLIPMLLHRMDADPAVASGTFVTTVTDVVGFFAFLGIATLWFRLG